MRYDINHPDRYDIPCSLRQPQLLQPPQAPVAPYGALDEQP
jgi:hypothetical protein